MFYPTLDVSDVPPLDVLAVAAHPNDAEWWCGATLRGLASAGKRTGILDLSTGDMSSRGIPQQRVKEADAAASILGLAWRGNLGLPDGRLENNILARMTLAGIVRALRPSIVLGPHPERRYPDHRYAWELLRDACEAAAWPKLDDDLKAHSASLVLRGAPDVPMPPTLCVPLKEDALKAKVESLLAYRSQFQPGTEDRHLFPTEEQLGARVRGLAETYGLAAGVVWAEPFYCETPLAVADLGSLIQPAS